MALAYGAAGGAGLIALKWLPGGERVHSALAGDETAGVSPPSGGCAAGRRGLRCHGPALHDPAAGLLAAVLCGTARAAERDRPGPLRACSSGCPPSSRCGRISTAAGSWGLECSRCGALCGLLSGTVPWRWAAVACSLGFWAPWRRRTAPACGGSCCETVRVGRAEHHGVAAGARGICTPRICGQSAALLILVAWRRQRWAAAPMVIPAAALGVLAFRVVRLQGFFVLAGVLLLAPCFAGAWPGAAPALAPADSRGRSRWSEPCALRASSRPVSP